MKQLEWENKQEYVILLNLLYRISAANEGLSFNSSDRSSDRERLWDAHLLTGVFISHALTILHLLDDTNVLVLPSLPPMRFIWVASASIDVLTRTTMEAFLVFHYVFFAPTTAEEKDYRYWSYKAAGIAEWLKLQESTLEHEQEQAKERKALDELHIKLKSNIVFQGLTGKNDRKKILRGEWRLKHWHDIAIDAKFSEMLASHIYSYLSGSAHSSRLSYIRMVQVLEDKNPKILIQGSINTMNILAANMIHEYCGLFPRAQDVLTKDLEGSNLVKQYIKIGRELDKYMGIQVGE